jgi:hypothetical protein
VTFASVRTFAARLVAPFFLTALMVAGCASPPAEGDIRVDRRDESVNIPPANPKGDLLALLRTYLNDPTRIREAAITEPTLKQVGPARRYVLCLRYNARDLDGKYTGAKERLAVFVNGKLDQLVEQPRELCAGAEYKPFPELERLTR